MSWGISDCFRSLSLSQGQVPHALLTRPPLSCPNASRRINWNNSVRLECVRHAASVHPEPGSNSRNILYTVLSDYIPILSSFCSALLLFCKSFYFLFGIASSLHFSLQFLVYFYTLYFLSLSYISIWCVVQFSRIKGQSILLCCTRCSPTLTAARRAVQVSALNARSILLCCTRCSPALTAALRAVQVSALNTRKFFFRAALLADSLYIIPLVFTLVKGFFKLF